MADQITSAQRKALDLIWYWAEKDTGGSARCRRLLYAWWNARELGGFDFADLWSLDDDLLPAAMTVINMIATLPPGTYLDEKFDDGRYAKRMRQLAEDRWQYLKNEAKSEPSQW